MKQCQFCGIESVHVRFYEEALEDYCERCADLIIKTTHDPHARYQKADGTFLTDGGDE